MIVITGVCFALGTAHAAPSVAVDLSRLDSQAADAAALEQALVMRLLQEGFAIDPLTEEPTIVVAIAGHDHQLVLTAKSAHFARSRTIDVATFKELAGVTRKNAIPLLEQLDAERRTRRVGNLREILV